MDPKNVEKLCALVFKKIVAATLKVGAIVIVPFTMFVTFWTIYVSLG